ncbi:hypothetical protein BDV96DRAFT_561832 [Lophiotrema nucula]|uniref:Zn(2)-C6 fungal-type domain-containing protein n=1 Tax=Lophiotrema nucula TaxID=690887 RepID=A0A6A5ZUP7_9PLEO|nr:hypothetical protein BDV96DRAFT_561832 [Lophiotrema nucula]
MSHIGCNMSPSNAGSGSRKFHSKSRDGCRRCKARRVKCNLQRPMCGNCHRRNEACEYANIPTTTHNTQAMPVLAFSSNSRCAHSLIHRIPMSQPLLLSALLDQLSVGGRPASPTEIALWNDTLSDQGLTKCEYLWHGIFSIHLLHTGHRDPAADLQSQVTTLAYQHHMEASKHFSHRMHVITDHNWSAVLGFGISVIVFQFATQQVCPDPLFDYFEMLLVLRSSGNVAVSVVDRLKASKMWPMIQERNFLPEEASLQASRLQGGLSDLEDAINGNTSSCVKHSSATLLALRSFRSWLAMCQGFPRTWGHYISWPATVSQDFIAALRQEEDLALLLLIYWCAIMSLGPRRWFMELWLRRTAIMATKKLDHGWQTLLIWPSEVLGIEQLPWLMSGVGLGI